jgi:hypothetical protein
VRKDALSEDAAFSRITAASRKKMYFPLQRVQNAFLAKRHGAAFHPHRCVR